MEYVFSHSFIQNIFFLLTDSIFLQGILINAILRIYEGLRTGHVTLAGYVNPMPIASLR